MLCNAGSESGDFKPVRGETEHAVDRLCAPDPLESVEREATKFENVRTSLVWSVHGACCFGLESARLRIPVERFEIFVPRRPDRFLGFVAEDWDL